MTLNGKSRVASPLTRRRHHHHPRGRTVFFFCFRPYNTTSVEICARHDVACCASSFDYACLVVSNLTDHMLFLPPSSAGPRRKYVRRCAPPGVSPPLYAQRVARAATQANIAQSCAANVCVLNTSHPCFVMPWHPSPTRSPVAKKDERWGGRGAQPPRKPHARRVDA
jgi:hypothetical protein